MKSCNAYQTNPIFYIPNCFKNKERCIEIGPWQLHDVPDNFKTQEMCDDAVSRDSCFLQYVSHWFLTQEPAKIWHDDDYYCDDDQVAEWYNGCKQRKNQKAEIKEKVMLNVWHLTRTQDFCMTEDEKKKGSRKCLLRKSKDIHAVWCYLMRLPKKVIWWIQKCIK